MRNEIKEAINDRWRIEQDHASNQWSPTRDRIAAVLNASGRGHDPKAIKDYANAFLLLIGDKASRIVHGVEEVVAKFRYAPTKAEEAKLVRRLENTVQDDLAYMLTMLGEIGKSLRLNLDGVTFEGSGDQIRRKHTHLLKLAMAGARSAKSKNFGQIAVHARDSNVIVGSHNTQGSHNERASPPTPAAPKPLLDRIKAKFKNNPAFAGIALLSLIVTATWPAVQLYEYSKAHSWFRKIGGVLPRETEPSFIFKVGPHWPEPGPASAKYSGFLFLESEGQPNIDVLSPVPLALFATLVNDNDTPYSLDSFVLENRSDDGNWFMVPSVDAKGRTILFDLGNGKAKKIETEQFEANLTKSIPPRGSIYGWIFLKLPSGKDSFSFTGEWRYRIYDATGKSHLGGITFSAERLDPSIDVGHFKITSGPLDLSRYKFTVLQ